MSCNIIDIDVIFNNLYSTGMELRDLYLTYKQFLPEDNLFDYLDLLKYRDDEIVYISKISWCGTNSGRTYDTFVEILEKIYGKIQLKVVFEDGDIVHYTNYKIEEIDNTVSDDILHLVKVAEEECEGKLTLMKFEDGWKVFFGTPELYDPFQISLVSTFPTLKEAVTNLKEKKICIVKNS